MESRKEKERNERKNEGKGGGKGIENAQFQTRSMLKRY
jgi:hypothetical protein